MDFEEVLSTFNYGDIAIIRSLLDAEKITYFLKGEHFNQMRPLVEAVRIMVRKDQIQKAKDILKDLKLTYRAITVNIRFPKGENLPKLSK